MSFINKKKLEFKSDYKDKLNENFYFETNPKPFGMGSLLFLMKL